MKKVLFLLIIFAGLFLSSCITEQYVAVRDPFSPDKVRRQQEMNRRNNTPNYSKPAHRPSKAYYRRLNRELKKAQEESYAKADSDYRPSKAYYQRAAKKAQKEAYSKASSNYRTSRGFYQASANKSKKGAYGPWVNQTVIKSQNKRR